MVRYLPTFSHLWKFLYLIDQPHDLGLTTLIRLLTSVRRKWLGRPMRARTWSWWRSCLVNVAFLNFAEYVLGLQRRLRQQASHVDWQVLKDLMTEEWFPRKMFRCKILSAESTLGSGSALPQAPGCSTSWLRTMQTTQNSQMVWTGRWY